jgi:hypothetical protein
MQTTDSDEDDPKSTLSTLRARAKKKGRLTTNSNGAQTPKTDIEGTVSTVTSIAGELEEESGESDAENDDRGEDGEKKSTVHLLCDIAMFRH